MLHREDIKAAIRKRGLTLEDVGKLLDPPVTSQAVTNVLGRHSRSARIEGAIALASGFSLAEVQSVTREEDAAKLRVASGETSGETQHRPTRLKIAGRNLSGRNAA